MPKPTDNTFNPGRIALGGTVQNPILYPPIPYFPIGYVYISVDPTNPAEYFGGTWQRLSKCFLYAADPATDNSTTDPFRAGQSGGGKATIKQSDLPNKKYEIEFKYDYDSEGNVDTTGLSENFGKAAKAGNAYPAYWDNKSADTAYYPAQSGHVRHNETLSYFDKTSTDYTRGPRLQTESLNGDVTQTALDIVPEYLSVYMWRRVE